MLSPGRAIDISHDVTITGAPVYPLHGRYLLTPVRFTRPSLLRLAVAKLAGGPDVVGLPSGGDRHALHRAGRAVFDDSRITAAAAAARHAGLVASSIQVRFIPRDIVGPSAGLAYALLIDDLLRPADVASGRVIAATGTIDATGAVGPIGRVAEKLIGARRAGAALMLLPINQLGQAGDARTPVVGVAPLNDALTALTR
jgi:PDZ domain-containing secreted protein